MKRIPQDPVGSPTWKQLARQAQFKPDLLASLCGVSERHLERVFKKNLGLCPTKWLRLVQCELAKSLISQGYSTKATATELGFLSAPHFCREFKRIVGVSPQRFAPGALIRSPGTSGYVGTRAVCH